LKKWFARMSVIASEANESMGPLMDRFVGFASSQ
jgi:hypothetical protein